MAVLQSTYPTAYPGGYAGMVNDGEESNRISRTVEDATAIGFGKAVFRGATDHGCTLTPSANLLGITIANYAAPPVQLTGAEADSYPQLSTAGILVQGVIWVVTSVAVTPAQPVYVTPAGVFTNVTASNTILTGWVFDATAGIGAIVPIARR